MRLTLFFMILGILSTSAKSYSQQTNLKLDYKSTSIKQILKEIEEGSNYDFVYSNNDFNVEREVDLKITDASVEDVLDRLLEGTGMGYSMIDHVVIISPNEMNGFSKIGTQQKITLTGIVTEASGAPLPGVTVVVKGTTNGTISDTEGKYTLQNVPADAILVYSFVGMKTLEIPVDGKPLINVMLEEDSIGLEEVVAIGYGTMKKSDLTGSVASVASEDLQKTANATIDQALQGKVSGVYITQNNGTPGGGVSVRIRGIGSINNSEPLYIVDGIQYAASQSERTSPLSSINPNDIESIEILKDAATTAIYGARAANGVILITTKKGSKGIGEISYDGYYGVQQMAKAVEVMNGEQYANFTNIAAQNAGIAVPFENPSSFGAGTDWVDEVTQIAPMQNHNISFSKGNENGNFFLSLGYFDQEGTVVGSHFRRLSMRFNGESQIRENFKVGANVGFMKSDQQRDAGNRDYIGTVLARAYMIYPTAPAYDSEGNYSGPEGNSIYKDQTNPVYWAKNIYVRPKTNELSANVFGELTFLKNFKFRSSGSYRLLSSKQFQQDPIYQIASAISTDNQVSKDMSQFFEWTFENTINYTNTFDSNHKVNFLAGGSLQDANSEVIKTSVAYPYNGRTTTSLDGEKVTLVNEIQEHSLASVFGRAFYSFKDKYLITANVRYDGSSRFGSEKRWGVFPSFSGAWRVSEEDFFSNEDLSLKVRAGWGQVGANEIGNYAKYALIGSGNYYPMGNTNGSRLPGSALKGIPNPELQWETSTQSNIGFDITAYNGKLTLSADYYTNKRSDMLLGVPVSALAGISFGTNSASVTQNVAELKNSGLEFAVSYSGNINKVKYDVNANFNTYKNEVVDLGGKNELFSFGFNSNYYSRTYVGGELGEFYGYVFDGIFQTQADVDAHATQGNAAPGDFRFKDVSGPDGTPDGIIDGNDQTSVGSPIPDFTFGLNANLSYKNFDLSMQFNGVVGNEIYNLTKFNMMDLARTENKLVDLVNYWDGPGSTNEFPRPHLSDPNRNIRPSSYFVEDGSFVRCRLLQVGYNMPMKGSKSLGISNLRIYGSIQNLFTLTGYSGVDPEVGNYNGSNLGAGIDQFVYPISRTYLMGINIKF